jgi:hypothetical protein
MTIEQSGPPQEQCRCLMFDSAGVLAAFEILQTLQCGNLTHPIRFQPAFRSQLLMMVGNTSQDIPTFLDF